MNEKHDAIFVSSEVEIDNIEQGYIRKLLDS